MIRLPIVPNSAAPPHEPFNGPPRAPQPLHDDALDPVRRRLIDSHGRTIREVRLSLTDRCNFRCVYCMDPDFRYMPKRELLTLQEYLTLGRVLRSLGVTKIRLTGGEPTLYPDLDAVIAGLAAMGVPDLTMTTNGSLLTPERAARWKRLGLGRVTLSLDSLRDDRVRTITRSKTGVSAVIQAIRAAQDAGLGPVKVNAVILRGVNDDELPDFADFALKHGVDYRLIEFMPLDSQHQWSMDRVVSAREMRERIERRHPLTPEQDDPSSTSMNFRIAGRADARIGLIAPVTRPFCGACSRLRITADGKVRPCLFSHDEWDLRAVLRSVPLDDPGMDERLTRFLIDATWTKQAGHGIGSRTFAQPARTMSAIGG